MSKYDTLEATRVELVDPRNKIRPVMSWEHHKIHAGRMFTASNKIDVATAKVGAIQITVPAGKLMHMKATEITATVGPVIVNLLEDYTFVGGAAITPFNRNRTSLNTPVVTLKGIADATAVAGSVPISLDMVVLPASGVGVNKIGANVSADEEILLNEGTYLLTFSNTNAATATVGYSLNWYESTI